MIKSYYIQVKPNKLVKSKDFTNIDLKEMLETSCFLEMFRVEEGYYITKSTFDNLSSVLKKKRKNILVMDMKDAKKCLSLIDEEEVFDKSVIESFASYVI